MEKTFSVSITVSDEYDSHEDVLESFLEKAENSSYHTENEISYGDIRECKDTEISVEMIIKINDYLLRALTLLAGVQKVSEVFTSFDGNAKYSISNPRLTAKVKRDIDKFLGTFHQHNISPSDEVKELLKCVSLD